MSTPCTTPFHPHIIQMANALIQGKSIRERGGRPIRSGSATHWPWR